MCIYKGNYPYMGIDVQKLLTLNKKISTLNGVKELYESIGITLKENTQAENIAIWMIDSQTLKPKYLECIFSIGPLHDKFLGGQLSLEVEYKSENKDNRPLVLTIFEEKSPKLILNPKDLIESKSSIGVPLINQNECIGVIEIHNVNMLLDQEDLQNCCTIIDFFSPYFTLKSNFSQKKDLPIKFTNYKFIYYTFLFLFLGMLIFFTINKFDKKIGILLPDYHYIQLNDSYAPYSFKKNILQEVNPGEILAMGDTFQIDTKIKEIKIALDKKKSLLYSFKLENNYTSFTITQDEYKLLEQQLINLLKEKEFYPVRSPIHGYLTAIEEKKVILTKKNSYLIQFEMNQTELLKIKLGQILKFIPDVPYKNKFLKIKINKIIPQVEPGKFLIEAIFQGDITPLRTNMTGRVEQKF